MSKSVYQKFIEEVKEANDNIDGNGYDNKEENDAKVSPSCCSKSNNSDN